MSATEIPLARAGCGFEDVGGTTAGLWTSGSLTSVRYDPDWAYPSRWTDAYYASKGHISPLQYYGACYYSYPFAGSAGRGPALGFVDSPLDMQSPNYAVRTSVLDGTGALNYTFDTFERCLHDEAYAVKSEYVPLTVDTALGPRQTWVALTQAEYEQLVATGCMSMEVAAVTNPVAQQITSSAAGVYTYSGALPLVWGARLLCWMSDGEWSAQPFVEVTEGLTVIPFAAAHFAPLTAQIGAYGEFAVILDVAVCAEVEGTLARIGPAANGIAHLGGAVRCVNFLDASSACLA